MVKLQWAVAGGHHGRVLISKSISPAIAASRLVPHISSVGRKLAQKAGRSGLPKSAQRKSASNWTHRTPAGLPCGIPGIGDVMEGAIQHAPH